MSVIRSTAARPAVAPAQASQVLRAVVADFEARGGSGEWLRAPSPVTDANAAFYRIAGLPNRADPAAKLDLLKIDRWRRVLKAALDEGATVILGELGAGIKAMALGAEFELTTQALKAARRAETGNIVLVQPHADKYTLAHELQHWRDFEAEVHEDFLAEVEPLIDTPHVPQMAKDYVARLMWEIRGHQAQTAALVADQRTRAALVVGDKVKARGSADDFGMQQRQVLNNFNDGYRELIFALFSGAKKASVSRARKLSDVFHAYNLTDGEPNIDAVVRSVLR